MIAKSVDGVTVEAACRRLKAEPQDLGMAFEKLVESGEAIGFAGLWYAPEHFRAHGERFVAALEEMHEHKPDAMGFDPEKVVARAGLRWSGKRLDRILKRMELKGHVVVRDYGVRSADRRPKLKARQAQMLSRVVEAIDGAGLEVPSSRDLAAELGVPSQAIDNVIELGVDLGDLERLDPTLVVSNGTIQRVLSEARERLGSDPFEIGAFKQAVGCSRRIVLALAEWADDHGMTERDDSGSRRFLKDA